MILSFYNLKGQRQYNQFASPTLVENTGNDSRFLWYLPLGLFRTHKTRVTLVPGQYRLGYQLPDCQGCQCIISRDVENSELPQALVGRSKRLSTYPDPHKALCMIIHPSASQYPSHGFHPVKTAQVTVQRVNKELTARSSE